MRSWWATEGCGLCPWGLAQGDAASAPARGAMRPVASPTAVCRASGHDVSRWPEEALGSVDPDKGSTPGRRTG